MHIIIVGSGIGGLSAAVLLGKKGHKVTVIEKLNRVGGRCSVESIDGFRFDIGASMLLMPEIFEEMFDRLGMDRKEYLDWYECHPTSVINFEDGTKIELDNNLNKVKKQFENIEKGCSIQTDKYYFESKKHYEETKIDVLSSLFLSLSSFFTPTILYKALTSLHLLDKQYNRITKYFKSDYIQRALTFQTMYLGISPYDAPATMSLLQYSELSSGIMYTKGGMGGIAQTLMKIAEELYDVKFMMNTGVKRILESKTKVSGVELEDGSKYFSDYVICNADLVYCYNNLLKPTKYGKSLLNYNHTCSTISIYLGINKQISIEAHNVYLYGDYRKSFDTIFKKHDIPKTPSFYVHVPSKIDKTSAPEGYETVIILIPVGHKQNNFIVKYEDCIQQVLDIFYEKFDINENNILCKKIRTPNEWESEFNLPFGSALGLSHNMFQLGYFRPHNQHNTYKNLLFVGASTQPGTGVPITMKSGMLVVDTFFSK